MTLSRTRTAVLSTSVVLLALTGCRMDLDEMVMNPSSRDEIITRLLEESVAKQTIMNRLTSDEASKTELAETLLGDNKIKPLAIERLTSDGGQRGKIIDTLLADPVAKPMIIDKLLADETVRPILQEGLKKPLPKKPAEAEAPATK